MNKTFEKRIEIRPAFDKRSDNPNKDYGIGGMRIYFHLIGKKGIISCEFFTPVFLPETITEYLQIGNKHKTVPSDLRNSFKGEPEGIKCGMIGCHSYKPQFKGHGKSKCGISRKYCYFDSSALKGDDDKVGDILMREGSDAVWKYLEKTYKEWIK